ELTQSVADCVAEAGFDVVRTAGMGLVSNREIGCVTPAQICAFAAEEIYGVSADCVFLSCTNWRALDSTKRLQDMLGINVISSNKACIDEIIRIAEQGSLEAADLRALRGV